MARAADGSERRLAVTCPKCGVGWDVPVRYAGRTVTCRLCRAVATVPDPTAEDLAVSPTAEMPVPSAGKPPSVGRTDEHVVVPLTGPPDDDPGNDTAVVEVLPMTGHRRTRRILLGHLAWVAVFAFWLVVTRDHHPTFALAVIVTASLVTAFALSVDVNHFLLVPRFWRPGRYGIYAAALLATMAALTALALVVIRVSYSRLHGPDPDPYGACKHFAIDLFGTVVHVAVAAGVVWLWRRVGRWRR